MLGGVDGQTVFGELTTGTHGGDFAQPPIADSVAALHLVADGRRTTVASQSRVRFLGS